MFSAGGYADQDPNDGSYYIGRSPQFFDLILDYMRSGEVRGLKKLDKIEKAQVLEEVMFYGITELISALGGSGMAEVEGMCWDPNRNSFGINLSNNNMTAVSTGSCSHKTVCGSIPITHGIVAWEVMLNQTADCYSAIGIVGESFNYSANERIGISNNSWGLGLYPGSHCDTSDRRIQASSRLNSNQVVKCIYDADEHTLKITVDSQDVCNYKNVNLEKAYIALTVCESQGGGYTLRNVEAL
jgi:hypothetical protein